MVVKKKVVLKSFTLICVRSPEGVAPHFRLKPTDFIIVFARSEPRPYKDGGFVVTGRPKLDLSDRTYLCENYMLHV